MPRCPRLLGSPAAVMAPPVAWLPAIVWTFSLLLATAAPALAQIKVTELDPQNDGQIDQLQVDTPSYQAVIDLNNDGTVASLLYKPLNHEFRAENYYGTANDLFCDWIRLAEPDPESGLTPKAGKLEMRTTRRTPASYRLLPGAPGAAAPTVGAEFAGPGVTIELTSPASTAGGQAWMAKILRRRRITFRGDSPAIRVEVEVVNQDSIAHSVLVESFNGLSLGRVDSTLFLPTADGRLSVFDPGQEKGSRFLFAPQLSSAWQGGVAQGGLAAALSFDFADLDAMEISAWKTVGAAYITTFRRREAPAQGAIVLAYHFLPLPDFISLDGMAGDLAGGITVGKAVSVSNDVDLSELKVGATVPLQVQLCSGSRRSVHVVISCLRLEDKQEVFHHELDLDLAIAQNQAVTAELPLPTDGLYVLSVRAQGKDGADLLMEKPLQVGRSRLSFTPSVPKVALRGVRDGGEQVGPAAFDPQFKTIDRSFVTPHLPLLKNDAAGAVRTFFLTGADSSLGHVREITQRGDFDFDYAAATRIANPPDELHFREVDHFVKSLRAYEPQALCTIAINWSAGLKRPVIQQLLSRVQDGMGLVIASVSLNSDADLFNALADAVELKDLPLPACATRLPPLRFFTLGKGRVVLVQATGGTYRDGGEAALGDWKRLRVGTDNVPIDDLAWRGFEYSYAGLGQLIRWSAGKESPLTVTAAGLDGQSVTLQIGNMGAACPAEADITVRSSQWQVAAIGKATLSLPAGNSSASVKLSADLPDGPAAVEVSLRSPAGKLLAFASAGVVQKGAVSLVGQALPSAYQSFGKKGGSVQLTVAARGSESVAGVLEARLVDRFGRLVLRQEKALTLTQTPQEVSISLDGLPSISIYHELEARLYRGSAVPALPAPGDLLAQHVTPVFLLPAQPPYRDRFILGCADGPERRALHLQALLPTVRALGFTQHTHSHHDGLLFATGGMANISTFLRPTHDGRYSDDPKKKQSMDGKTLVMDPPLQPWPAAEAATKEGFQQAARAALERGVFLIQIDDERRMSGSFDMSPATLAGFRQWLRGRYADIAQLNQAWAGQFADFDAVTPTPREKMAESQNYAPWLEFRMYIGHLLGEYYMLRPGQWAQEVDPRLSAGEFGIFEPNYTFPIDWARYARSYQFTQRYGDNQGALEDLFLDFAPDTHAGVWTGYGMTKISPGSRIAPWACLLNGGHFAFYWAMVDSGYWGYGIATSDQRPTAGYAALAQDEFPDLTGGIDRMIMASSFSRDPIAIAYSFPSYLVSNQALAYSSKRIIEELGYQHRYVNLDDLPEGSLSKDGYRVLVLQETRCLSPEQVQQIAAFALGGGSVLVVGNVGTHSPHGEPWPAPLLDKLTGVDLSKARALNQQLPVRLGGQACQLFVSQSGVTVKDAQMLAACVEGQFQDLPVLTVRGVGKGAVYYLNSTLRGHDAIHAGDDIDPGGDGRERVISVAKAHWFILDRIVADSGIAPRLRIVAGKENVFDTETWYYASPSGATQLVGHYLRKENDKELTLRFAQPRAIYDVRAQKLLGTNAQQVQDSFPAGRMKIYALLASPVARLTAALKQAEAAPGGVVEVTCTVSDAAGKPVDLDAVQLQVVDPAGKVMACYAATALVQQGQASFRVPLALNETPGQYQLQLKEVIAGKTAACTLTVK